MVNIDALMRALPVSALEPSLIGIILGLVPDSGKFERSDAIDLMEPPAGRCVPYVEPAGALTTLLRHGGASLNEAKAQARVAVVHMAPLISGDRWAVFFDSSDSELPPHLPVPDFVDCARKLQLLPPELTDFLEKATDATTASSLFRGGDYWNEPWSLSSAPALPPPKAMIEFVPGPPWDDFEYTDTWNSPDNPFIRWREAMHPVAKALEDALGEPVYHFADLDDDLDDDDVHRFLVLHWCCTWKPDSAFVRHLVKVSGARHVDELKAALIDPGNYTHPFKMNESFFGVEATICRIDYVPPDVRKTVVVAFRTLQARDAAEGLLSRQIGACASIVAPPELATDDWIRHATRHCRDWTGRYPFTSLDTDQGTDGPLEILALADQVCVIADAQTAGRDCDMQLSASAEDLYWLARECDLDARYYSIYGVPTSNPEHCIATHGAPERVAAQRAHRAAFTRQLTEIRLDCDWSSSGLWNERGQMLAYDLLDLPFPLIRRIAAWQRDFDETLNPPNDIGDDAWWECHQREQVDIAKALQQAVGSNVALKLFRQNTWRPIDEIKHDNRGNT